MSDANEHEKAGQGKPSVVEENKLLVDIQPKAGSALVPVEKRQTLLKMGQIMLKSIDNVGMVVEGKPEGCGVVDSKNFDNGDPMPASHNEPAISQPAPTDTNTEFVNVLEVENKADEKQAMNLLIIWNSM
ncbi:hypothetical protein VNO80_01580 [Phaseolus coccineus]|uniref:Uncharacterized protein n=1 Tax=Phaseolus coccineus TaxID=3886 RepID=A0AAN9RT37_PHACN